MTNTHPLTAQERSALLEYARSYGRTWKASLLSDWERARQPGVLQHLRNIGGPSWLLSVRVDVQAGTVSCRHLPGRPESERGKPCR